MNVKKIGAEAAIVGALAVTTLGIGSGVAGADQPIPDSPGATWSLDRGHGEGGEGPDWDGDWNGWRDGPQYWNGPQYWGNCAWVPPAVSMWVPPAVC